MKKAKIILASGLLLLLCSCSNQNDNKSEDNTQTLTPSIPSIVSPSDAPKITPTTSPVIDENDVDYMWVVDQYNKACDLEAADDFLAAYDIYQSISEYINVENVISQCSYYAGIRSIELMDFETARSCFEKSIEYKDSKDYLTYLDIYKLLQTKYDHFDSEYKYNTTIHTQVTIAETEPILSTFYGSWVNEKNKDDIISISEKYLNEKEYKVINCVSLNGLPLNYVYLSYSDTPDETLRISYNKELKVIQYDGNIYKKSKKSSATFDISGEYDTIGEGNSIKVFKHSLYNVIEMSINGLADGTKTELVIPSQVGPFKVTTLMDTALEKCSKIKSVILPDTIKTIKNNSLSDCDSLTSVQLSSYLESIGDNSLSDTQITELFIPKSVLHIGENTFTNNKKLTKITVEEGNPAFASLDGVLYNKNMSALLVYPAGKKDKEYVIPDTVKHIKANAFYNNKYIESITFPSGLVNLDDSTMYGCSKLAKLIFKGDTPITNNELFKGAAGLTIEGPYEAPYLEDYAKARKFKIILADPPAELEVINDNEAIEESDIKATDDKNSDNADN